jgi:hypothetical protein
LARGAALRTIRDMLYLILAFVWLTVGVGVLVYQAVTGDQGMSLHLLGTPLSPGWVMIVLGVYNLLRWWSRRPPRPSWGGAAPPSQRQRARRAEEPHEPDPNFIFTDDPPPEPPPRDVPPSRN